MIIEDVVFILGLCMMTVGFVGSLIIDPAFMVIQAVGIVIEFIALISLRRFE